MSVARHIHDRLQGQNVLVVGRAGMDLYPIPDGSTIETAEGFIKDVGGSAGNIAVALARLGMPAALFSAFSDDAIGRFVRRKLDEYGVNTSCCPQLNGLERTSLAMAETRAENPSVVIYRNNAADLGITKIHAENLDIQSIGVIVVTGTALSSEPSRSACLRLAERAREHGCPLILDIDYRPQAWKDRHEAQTMLGQMASHADMVVANDEEFDVVADGNEGGDNAGRAYAEKLAHSGALILYKMGRGGCDILDGSSSTPVGIFDVEALKPFGAGDAFMGGVISALSESPVLQQAVSRGAAAAAMVVSRRGCASAMPDKAELVEFMASRKLAEQR